MTRVPEAWTTAGCDGGRRGNVKDQSYCSAMEVAAHVAHLARHGETEDGARVVRIRGRGLKGGRLELQNLGKQSIVALDATRLGPLCRAWIEKGQTCIVVVNARQVKLFWAVRAIWGSSRRVDTHPALNLVEG